MLLSSGFNSRAFFRQSLLLPLLLLSSKQTTNAMSTVANNKPAALIFLHGLGDTPAGWSSLEYQLPSIKPSLSNLTYIFPPAPTIPISINGGMTMPGWFDLFDWPIGVGCQNDEEGKSKAVTQIEKCVDELVEKGIDKNRIVIGGFSQGGAVALRAVYQSEEKYAACVNLSGWLTFDESTMKKSSASVPLMWGHGSFDDKVLFEQQKYGVDKLREMGVEEIQDSSYPVGHGAHPNEMEALAEFLDMKLFSGEEKAEK